MADGKRKSDGRHKGRRRYRSDGTPVWGQRSIDGPGVWVSCVKGKEKQTVGELYDLFESLASELWPDGPTKTTDEKGSDNESDVDDLEQQIAKEVASMKRPRKEQRFANCQTNTPCVVFISCKPPVDPVTLVVKHIQNVIESGVTNTRYTQRLTPISGSCVANVPEIQSLCNRIIKSFFSSDPERKYSYKIELRMRNHNTLSRSVIIQEVAKCVPEGHKVDLENPEVFILVKVFKSVCGMSVVKDYYRLQKFNVMEIADGKNEDENSKMGEGRFTRREQTVMVDAGETPAEKSEA
ncbi:hypothetical protein AcV7_006601 [Taiwanofungus camphoratus]|nr:hypothetical protein AcV7_006601 [Antrodia cinnamomea]